MIYGMNLSSRAVLAKGKEKNLIKRQNRWHGRYIFDLSANRQYLVRPGLKAGVYGYHRWIVKLMIYESRLHL